MCRCKSDTNGHILFNVQRSRSKKLTLSSLEIETYTNDVVKIIGTCQFYLVHPESKQLMKVIFFVAKENGSVLLSCRTNMELGLIKPHA